MLLYCSTGHLAFILPILLETTNYKLFDKSLNDFYKMQLLFLTQT